MHIFEFEYDDTINGVIAANYVLRAHLVEDRSNDPGHRDPDPDWRLERLEVFGLGKIGADLIITETWVALPSSHPMYTIIHGHLHNALRRAVDRSWAERERESA